MTKTEAAMESLQSIDFVDLWPVLTALRGPDFETTEEHDWDTLKVLTTSVIRYFVGMSLWSAQASVSSPKLAKRFWELQTSEVQADTIRAWLHSSHFRWHASAAFDMLAKYNKEAKEYSRWFYRTIQLQLTEGRGKR